MIVVHTLLLGALSAWGPREVFAQGTSAFCGAGYAWMSNSKGQSPCLISSYLFTSCSSQAASWVFPLDPGYHYNTPLNNAASATPWSKYSENCSTVYVNNYPKDIPSGTAVPAWAYLDITAKDRFDPVAAEAVVQQGAAESTASSNTPTSGTVLTNAPSATTTAIGAPESPNANSGNTSNSSKKSSNLAAIVGGAVGGGVGLIAIGRVIFFWLRHRRNAARDAPTRPLDLTAGEHGQNVEKLGDYQAIPPPIPSPKLYDPDDPSTFPDSPDAHADSSHGSTTVYSMSAVQGLTPALPYAYPVADARQSIAGVSASAAYKGVPEL
ncbi:hypothetical protein BV20DRAFT_1043942 [Pilatotrama ljubarskyi]|nr:hypothetical protein BV20DRAFT_1043942 [Pilatotrama ljubarskyi]